jgi:putative intracellular protease/amidase
MNRTILCFVAEDMADFEVTLALQILRNHGSREILTVGYERTPVVSQTGFTHLPQFTPAQCMDLPGIEAMIFPGGPIRPQREDLTRLIQKLDEEKKCLAAICFGPQYLGRARVLDRHPFTTSCSEQTIQSLGVADPYPRRNYVEARVVVDEHVITAKGSAFVDFAFAISDVLHVYEQNPGRRNNFYHEIMDRSPAALPG